MCTVTEFMLDCRVVTVTGDYGVITVTVHLICNYGDSAFNLLSSSNIKNQTSVASTYSITIQLNALSPYSPDASIDRQLTLVQPKTQVELCFDTEQSAHRFEDWADTTPSPRLVTDFILCKYLHAQPANSIGYQSNVG